MRLIVLSIFCICITFTTAIGFKGKIEGIPSVNELYHTKNKIVPNGDNYNNRISVDLYFSNSFTPITTVVDSKYNFKFNNLESGEYELLVNSYDFGFEQNRFKIIVDDESIVAYEHGIGQDSYNTTSITNLNENPLPIKYLATKEFYEYHGGSLSDLLMNSPFGFIFKNRYMTIVFTACLAIMAAPYILQVVSPEFAAELNQIQAQTAKERLGEKVIEPSESTVRSTGINKSQGAVKKRR
ncbi:conserved hypothetical protein [Candida dubliniensis CD36]|uniref:ER membrane protein complex subunit 7 beta-sandwich domain-containing protein n=1 Tax=Candida dubliniensis (strain CD36 / ATCC MYA-646 / CBS 7987 / NCPF 3949 / NRRL Y-17841) TaxID=573826 RepID=B9W846_CANDC|nr:conserved hypothetical protein [Candida dubliniensis CD36]CAX44882.1 conserved hypothetical protein [Candida dubliniensis CD36]